GDSTNGYYNAATLITAADQAGLGSGYALLSIDMAAMNMLDTGQDCQECYANNGECSNEKHYACDHTEGDPTAHIPWQWYQIAFESLSGGDSCGVSETVDVEFNVYDVLYPETGVEDVLKGTAIDCVRDGRQPMGIGNEQTKNDKFSVSLTGTVNADDIKGKVPWRVEFAGISLESEANKDVILDFNAGMDGTTVTFPETEHRDCALQSDNTYKCSQRTLTMHFCTELRDDEPSIDPTGTINWGQNSEVLQTMQFFTEIQDPADKAWAALNGKYLLECPDPAYLNTIKLAGNFAKLSCDSMSTRTRTEDTRPNSAVYCSRGGVEGPDRSTGLRPDTLLKYHDDQASITIDGQTQTIDEWEYYCGPNEPRRLMWQVTLNANSDRDILKCPTEGGQSVTNDWKKLPRFNFTTLDDGNTINLSKRPKLCLKSGKLPWDTNIGPPESCAYFGARTGLGSYQTVDSVKTDRCIDLRIQDDEMTHMDNAKQDADSFEMATSMAPPVWNTTSGEMQIQVSNLYPVTGSEKQLINVAPGNCLASGETDLQTVWNGASSLSAIFGTCDMLSQAGVHAGSTFATMADVYAAIFGSDSAQLSQAEYDGTDATKNAYGFSPSDGKTNHLFPAPRDLTSVNQGNKWTVSKNQVSSRDGFTAQLAATLEGLRACRDRAGEEILDISAANGFTTYKFNMSSTIVTAQRPEELNWVHWSPVCTQRAYEITVSNTMFAMGGMQTDEKSHMYVDSMRYVGTEENECLNAAACDGSHLKGPQNTCPTSAEYNPATLKKFEYKVNMDFKVNSNVNGAGNTFNTYYGIGAMTAAAPNSQKDNVEVQNNCYNSEVHSITPYTGATTALTLNDPDVTRTQLTFRTKDCFELRPDIAAGTAAPDTFVTCDADASQATKFDFRARVWECTAKADLADPLSSTNCYLLPDWVYVHITLGFVQDVQTISYEVDFETKMAMYRSVDHRLPDGSFIPNVRGIDGVSARDTWRQENILERSAAQPVPTLTKDASLAISLGFTDNSPLASTMTSAIRSVRLCRFKEFCFLEKITIYPTMAQAGVVACTYTNMFVDRTHSPYAHWARNTILAGSSKGCSEKGTDQACKVKAFATAAGNTAGAFASELPYLTCHKDRWEDFIVAEAMQTGGNGFISNIFQGTNINANAYGDIGLVIAAMQPVIEAQSMVSNGATTYQAESVHGSCENPKHIDGVDSPLTEAILAEGDYTKSLQLTYLFPKEDETSTSGVRPSGVCTCKSQKAAMFTQDGTTYPYRSKNKRKVIYADSKYSNSTTDAANLHLCPWQITPQDKDYKIPQNSVDVFYMSIKYLTYNTDYNFEISSVVLDHNAYDQATLDADTNNAQFTDAETWPLASNQARRLLKFPAESHRGVALEAAKKDAARRTLSFMLPSGQASDASPQLIMPQGPVAQSQPDTQGVSQGSMGGFIVSDPDSDSAGSQVSLTGQAVEGMSITVKTHTFDNKEQMVQFLMDSNYAGGIDGTKSGSDWGYRDSLDKAFGNLFDLWWDLSGWDNYWTGVHLLAIQPLDDRSDVKGSTLTNVSFATLMSPFGGDREWTNFGSDPKTYDSSFDWMPALTDLRPAISIMCSFWVSMFIIALTLIGLAMGNVSESMAHAPHKRLERDENHWYFYSVSFYRMPGAVLTWPNFTKPQPHCCDTFCKWIINMLRVAINEVGLLLLGSYVLSLFANFFMWILMAFTWIVRLCFGAHRWCKKDTEEPPEPNYFERILEMIRVGMQTLFKIFLDYGCLQMFFMMFAATKYQQDRKQKFDEAIENIEGGKVAAYVMELLKFVAVLMFRVIQTFFSLALIQFSIGLMLLHIAYYFVVLIFNRGCAKCKACVDFVPGTKFVKGESNTIVQASNVGLPDDDKKTEEKILEEYDSKFSASYGLACWDWGTVEASGLVECAKDFTGDGLRRSVEPPKKTAEYTVIGKDPSTSKYTNRAQKHSNMKKDQKKGEFNV
ncbi:MAG: hypothetical protein CMJ52_10750, partial [Planctomycetaceae bacterium]|nr:hypothetical protein [Planctomycetaceae bacterium]